LGWVQIDTGEAAAAAGNSAGFADIVHTAVDHKAGLAEGSPCSLPGPRSNYPTRLPLQAADLRLLILAMIMLLVLDECDNWKEKCRVSLVAGQFCCVCFSTTKVCAF